MADKQSAGSIYYDVELETAQLLTGAKQVDATLDGMSSSAASTGKALDNLGKNTKSAASSLNQMTGYAKSMDGSIQTLNTNVSAMAIAIQQANASSANASMSLQQITGAINTLISSVNAVSAAMKSSATSTSSASSEFSRADAIIEGLANQIAILEEAQESGARSAAILAAQLRAGSSASDEEKQKIAALTGQLFDMKGASDNGAKGHASWKNSMQQAGYQVQDFIVQVQGGQSALVAFSQQGSQLAGAFGPQGAVIGALLALGTVLTGILMNAMGNTGNEMDKLASAAEALNKVVVINSQGVAALSNDFAKLAVTNATLAAQLRDNAISNYEVAVKDAGKAIQQVVDQQKSWFSGFSGGIASVKSLGDVLATLKINTDSYSEAFSQASKISLSTNSMASTLTATVSMLGDQFSISDDSAFGLAKRLSDLAKNPSAEAVSSLIEYMKGLKTSSDAGRDALLGLETKLLSASKAMQDAKDNADALNKTLNDLKTQAQQANFDSVSKQLETQRITLTKGKQAAVEYGIQQQDLTKDQKDALITQSRVVAALQDEEDKRKKAEAAAIRQGTAEESVAQKLANLKQQSELATGSTTELSRAQAILSAQQSLGKGATQSQIKLAGEYAAKKWDTANAIRAQVAAEKLVPETKENASYSQDLKDLNTALAAKKITQQQYNATSEQLEQQHQANLAKIRADQVVSPMQQAVGQVDPVQQLANENAQKLALIQQFVAQKVLTEQQGLLLMNAANMTYEKARTDAQWALFTQQSIGYEALGAAVDAFGSSAGSALSSVITGTESASEAARNLANTVLSSVIQTFVDMGVQQAKSAIMGASVQQATIAATTTAQVGALGVTTAASTASAGTTLAAWLPAALVASVGSFGAAAIIGGAALVGAFALSSALGKRKNGGPVTAGSTYQVGESGLPEIYQASNGSQYMIPGDNGKVISNKDMQNGTSASGNIQVNVYNNNGSDVQTSSSKGLTGQDVINIMVNDAQQSGPATRAIAARTGSRMQATGDY